MTEQTELMTWYHGGVPGLKAGEFIEPPDTTHTQNRLSNYVPDGAPWGYRSDVVYITSVQDHARAFAAVFPDGALYRVEPIGDLEPDPDVSDGSAVMCARAQIVEVVRERVVFAHRTIESWIGMLRR